VSYLLDTMIVSFFLQAGRESELAAAASRSPMGIADDVQRELENDRDRGGSSFKRWLASSGIQVIPILVGTPVAATLAQFANAASPHRGRGERASIALAAHDPSLTFVTHDRGAMWIALRELWAPGERMIGIAPFLRRLFDGGALTDPSIIDEIMSIVGDPMQRPTWLASWRASLSASPGAPSAPRGAPVLGRDASGR
jgi:hypothetical protein